ncbi:putative integrase/recombinase [Gossypium arboreum]|uniref:Putative integrase/recombinase n=1 Tax=Gossypium arboreum TaxID=29729 RepID=A0A0B0MCN2_GOSAR|nr:putative integrase/recombinase [Gossypium arboreum]
MISLVLDLNIFKLNSFKNFFTQFSPKHINEIITILPMTFYTFYNLVQIAQNTKHAKFVHTMLRLNITHVHTSPYILFISHFSPSNYHFCN